MERGERGLRFSVEGMERARLLEAAQEQPVSGHLGAADSGTHRRRARARGPPRGDARGGRCGFRRSSDLRRRSACRRYSRKPTTPLHQVYLLASLLGLGRRQGSSPAGSRNPAASLAADARAPGPRSPGARAAAKNRQPGPDGNGQGAARISAAAADAGHSGGARREKPRTGRSGRSCAAGSTRPTCPRRFARKPTASCAGWSGCRRRRPIIR